MSNSQPPGPFTPESVRAMLTTEVLKGEAVPNSAAVAALCHTLNTLRTYVDLRTIHWKAPMERRQQLASALIALETILPTLRSEVEQAREFHQSDNATDQANECQRAVDVIDGLTQAVTMASHCSILLHPAMRRETTVKWEQYSRDLLIQFKHVLPNSKKESGYRLIVAVMPNITGERPTLEAVKSHIKRNRPVKRGK